VPRLRVKYPHVPQDQRPIDPARCTECVGHFDEPQCMMVCPVECIDPDPEYEESREQLLKKLEHLMAMA